MSAAPAKISRSRTRRFTNKIPERCVLWNFVTHRFDELICKQVADWRPYILDCYEMVEFYNLYVSEYGPLETFRILYESNWANDA